MASGRISDEAMICPGAMLLEGPFPPSNEPCGQDGSWPSTGSRRRTTGGLRSNFLFDGGRLDGGPGQKGVCLQEGELTGWTLAAPQEWDALLAPHMARRVRACTGALASGTTAYLQYGWPITDHL